MSFLGLVIMGVSGCGKSHLGRALAAALPNAIFIEGDELLRGGASFNGFLKSPEYLHKSGVQIII